MTVAVIKTKAEQQLAEQFGAMATRLPGTGWVAAARNTAFGAFAARGLPSRRVEEWKYTDLRTLMKEAYAPATAAPVDAAAIAAALGPDFSKLDCVRLVFVNGEFSEPLSTFDAGRGTTYHIDSLADVLASGGTDWMKPLLAAAAQNGGAIDALNAALMTGGVTMRIEEGAEVAKVIHLVFYSASKSAASTAVRNMISVGARAKATILESHVHACGEPIQASAVTEIHIKDGAAVTHVKRVAHGPGGQHLGKWNVELGRDAHYRGFQFTADTTLARNEISVTYAGEGSKLDLSGVFLGRGSDHIDTTLVVNHAVPGCESRELFAGVLDGRARGIFQGKIIVQPNAQKSDGKMMARALMLSPDTEFDSKPELEIFADDVVCGHGSTAAQLDEDQLFYCMSRGIPEDEARALLVESFIGEAIAKVEHGGVQQVLAETARTWLKAGAGHGNTARGKG